MAFFEALVCGLKKGKHSPDAKREHKKSDSASRENLKSRISKKEMRLNMIIYRRCFEPSGS
jgi:hypothetical protein